MGLPVTSRASTPLLVLVGATASGKTSLLASVFGAGGALEGRAEVVSADAFQVYRGMDLGTAKPEPALRSSLPHHLIDIREPSEQFSAGDFVGLATGAIAGIRDRGLLPIVAGGTGFYVRNLLCGLPPVPPSDPGIRASVQSDLLRLGPGSLRAELEAGDPESAARIHANDHYRLARALEILRSSGRPLSSFLPEPASPGKPAGPLGRLGLRPLLVLCELPRPELAERIEARVGAMFEAGLAGEYRSLRAAGYGPGDPGMKAIGYAEFMEAEAEGLEGPELLAEARRRIVANTLHYAKRQGTYFRGLLRDLPGSHSLGPGPGAAERLLGLLAGQVGEGGGR